MQHSDFKIGVDFRHRGKLWRCTDVGTRVIAAICLSEVWVTKTKANTGAKERVRLTTIVPTQFDGPPYAVEEVVISERNMDDCMLLAEWTRARKVLGLSTDPHLGVTREEEVKR